MGNKTRPHTKQRCGAKTRNGTPCKNYAMANGRCRMHGGKSTGPKDRKKKSKDMKKNKNGEKHGLFSKYLPQETMDLVNSIEALNPIDILWDNIKIQYGAIIRAQRIMYVEGSEDNDIHQIQSGELGERFQVITANEKQSNFLQSQSRAMTTLTGMIKEYENLCNSEIATEYQKERINKLKAQTEKIKGVSSDIEDMSELRKLLLDD